MCWCQCLGCQSQYESSVSEPKELQTFLVGGRSWKWDSGVWNKYTSVHPPMGWWFFVEQLLKYFWVDAKQWPLPSPLYNIIYVSRLSLGSLLLSFIHLFVCSSTPQHPLNIYNGPVALCRLLAVWGNVPCNYSSGFLVSCFHSVWQAIYGDGRELGRKEKQEEVRLGPLTILCYNSALGSVQTWRDCPDSITGHKCGWIKYGVLYWGLELTNFHIFFWWGRVVGRWGEAVL